MGDLSTFCSLPQSLSSEVCNSPCRGHSHPLLSLFLAISFFEAILNENVFIYSFSVYLLLVYRKANDFCKLIFYAATLL
jgi:hypothetical protein